MVTRGSQRFATVLAFFIVIVLFAAIWAMISPNDNPGRKLLQGMHRHLAGVFGTEGRSLPTLSPFPRNVREAAPAPMMLVDEPTWNNVPGKQRFLQPDARLAYKPALRQRIRLDKLVTIAAGDDGRVYALHRDNMRVLVFSENLALQSQWSLAVNADDFLRKPVALRLWQNRVIVASEDGHLGWWQRDGTLLRHVKTSHAVCDFEVFSTGELLLVTPGEDYLLHRLTREGKERLAFAYRDSARSPTARIFDRARVAVLPGDQVALSYEYPYRLEFYDSNGHPLLSLTHPLNFTLVPPEVQRNKQGAITRVFRQIVVYDLDVSSEGLLYHLVRLKGAEGGNQWDVFSTTGEYLQRFFLPYNQRALCFANQAVYVLGAYPNYVLEKYTIETLTDASQIGEEWQEKILPH